MPATPAARHKQKPQSQPPAASPKTTTAATGQAQPEPAQVDNNSTVRLHITPFTPALLKAYLAPSVQPLATNISYHTLEAFPEKGFGYLELPAMEAQKLKKRLNGSTLKGSKVKIEDAKPEKRKAAEDEDVPEEKQVKRAKREKRKKENGVLEGVELEEGRKVKRGWTEPPVKSKKDRKEKKDKAEQKKSKYTKEPELLFNAKLTPVAATEVVRKEKSKGKKKDKKDKKKSSREVVVHEFEQNTKQPSFLKSAQLSSESKPAVEYVNGKGWVDEDGNVVEAETGKARNRRVLELVDTPMSETNPTTEKKPSATPEAESRSKSKSKQAKKAKKKHATPPPSSSESESDESSIVSSSSSSENDSSEVDSDAEEDALSSASSPAAVSDAPQMIVTPSSPDSKKEVHPLEALFKRPRPAALSTSGSNPLSTPAKGLAPINTSFSFFDDTAGADVDMDASENPPVTPFTQRDLEWRGLRSAAPTPDTAAIGRRFSFPWRNGSQEVDEDEDADVEAGKQLSNNTKANSSLNHLPGLVEENEDEEIEGEGAEQDGEENDESEEEANQTPLGTRKSKRIMENANGDGNKEESEFGKWFWENRGDNNRAWKKRRRDTLKAKRLRENRKITGSGRVG